MMSFLGLAHYRRYFTHNSFSASPRYFYKVNELNSLLEKMILLFQKKYIYQT